MEKIERNEEILLNTKVKNVLGTIIFIGLGVAIPRIFHVLIGANAGAILLPMHIAVLIAALTFGTLSATIVGISSVLFSFLLTGMPALARLPYMAIELVIYSVLVGLLSKKFNNYISLFISMVVGRIIYAGVLISANILGFTTYGVSVIESTKIGLVGIILQLLFIPIISQKLSKGLNLKND